MAMKSTNEAGNGACTYTTMKGASNTIVVNSWEKKFTVAPSPARNTAYKPPFANPIAYTKVWTRECQGYMRTEFFNYYMPQSGVIYWAQSTGVHPGYLRRASTPDLSDVYAKAVAKLYDAMKNSEINVGASLIEGRETLEMIQLLLPKMPDKQTRKTFGLLSAISAKAHRTATALFVLQRDLKRKTTKTIGSSWLGWSLGVAPLLADIENLRSHLLTDGKEGPLLFTKARASGTTTTGFNSTNPSDEGCTVNGWFSRREEIGVFYRIHNLHTFENWRAGLSLRPSQIWEGVTLSFLVDYFIKIGELMETFENAFLDNGITFVSGYRTTTSQEVHTTRWYGNSQNGYQHSIVDLSGDIGITTKNRQLLAGFPVFVKPRMQIPRSAQKLSIIGALLSQLKK